MTPLRPSVSGNYPHPNWDDLDFRHLKFAIAVAEQQSFVKAADHLQIDQGFLSRQIRLLEKRLGFELFDRRRRSPLTLTEAGKVFIKETRFILAHTQQTIESAQQINRGKKGRLTVGINTSIANSKLPDILSVFHTQYPDVTLVLEELASYNQIEQLRQQQLDIGFFHLHNLRMDNDHINEPLISKLVMKESLILVLPDNHRLAKRSDSLSLAVLSNEPFILPPATLLYGLREQIDQLCIAAGFKPKVRQEAAWISTVLSLVAGGMGISILPANVENLRRNGVIYRGIQGEHPELEIGAVWHRNNPSVILTNLLTVIDSLS